jgi:hypothetical protein
VVVVLDKFEIDRGKMSRLHASPTPIPVSPPFSAFRFFVSRLSLPILIRFGQRYEHDILIRKGVIKWMLIF